MLDILVLVAAFGGDYAASIFSWPAIRAGVTGVAAEVVRLRARAKALEDSIKGEL